MLLCVPPAGKGVSSSAAVETATMTALVGAYGREVAGRKLAIMCQQAENLVVGAPCGIMDQVWNGVGGPCVGGCGRCREEW